MRSFSDAARVWKDLDAAAKSTGSREARQQAEQARIALAHHPDANRARDFHNHRVANSRGAQR